MLAQARVKLKNAESSIAFLQEQHTRTLEGLHQEIQRLQQKNANLTFELAVKGSASPASGSSDCCKHEKELKSYRGQVNSLKAALAVCQEEMKLLRHQLSNSQSAFSEEVRERESQIGQLVANLNQKARIVAHLTKQLHHMKTELTEASTSLLKTVAATALADCGTGEQRRAAADRLVMATGQIRRRTRRATASALPDHLKRTEPRDKAPTRRSLPAPSTTRPPTPHPPSVSPWPPSSSPPQRVLRRASKVVHRGTQSATALQEEPSQILRQKSATNLDPVKLQKQPPNVTDLLENFKSDVCIMAKSPPPILPPIPTNPDLTSTRQATTTRGHPDSVRHGHAVSTRSQPAVTGELVEEQSRLQLRQRGKEGGPQSRQKGRKSGANSRQRGRDAEGTLLVKEDIHRHGKSQAWQELHQSGSD